MSEAIFRYSMKAIIIKDNKLLVESCDYGRGLFCKLPGGVISGGIYLFGVEKPRNCL